MWGGWNTTYPLKKSAKSGFALGGGGASFNFATNRSQFAKFEKWKSDGPRRIARTSLYHPSQQIRFLEIYIFLLSYYTKIQYSIEIAVFPPTSSKYEEVIQMDILQEDFPCEEHNFLPARYGLHQFGDSDADVKYDPSDFVYVDFSRALIYRLF